MSNSIFFREESADRVFGPTETRKNTEQFVRVETYHVP